MFGRLEEGSDGGGRNGKIARDERRRIELRRKAHDVNIAAELADQLGGADQHAAAHPRTLHRMPPEKADAVSVQGQVDGAQSQ